MLSKGRRHITGMSTDSRAYLAVQQRCNENNDAVQCVDTFSLLTQGNSNPGICDNGPIGDVIIWSSNLA